jgi:hypothetical protein
MKSEAAAASFGLAPDSLVDVVQSVEDRAAPCDMKSDHFDGRQFFNPTGPTDTVAEAREPGGGPATTA